METKACSLTLVESTQNNRQKTMLEDKMILKNQYMLGTDNLSNRPSIGMNTIWDPLIKKERSLKKKKDSPT